MDYETALKTANAVKKTAENYLMVRLAYDNKIVLPYKDGVALVQALQSAEQIQESYGEQAGITPIAAKTFTVTPMSRDEYLNYRMAMLMGCTLEQVRQASLQITPEELTA